MKKLVLERCPTTHFETQGFLSFLGNLMATIERPWIEVDESGGKPRESCVPDGKYDLIPHTRPDGKKVVALVNHALGVYYLEEDMPPEGGRFLILMHVANYKKDVVGCIGPGKWKSDSEFGPMVCNSGAAMKQIMKYINGQKAQLEIRWI